MSPTESEAEPKPLSLSAETINYLKHFAKVQPSLVISPGNTLRTRTEAMYAEVKVKEEFPAEVCIRHLPEFLRVVSAFKEPVFTFAADHVLISEADGSAETKYPYAKPETVPQLAMRPKAIEIPADHVSFKLSESQCRCLQKALSTGAFGSYLKISSDGKKVVVGTTERFGSAPEYTVVVEEATTNGQACEMVFAAQNVPLLPGSYAITVTPLFTKFNSTSRPGLMYISGPEPTSSWGPPNSYTVVVTESGVRTCQVPVLAHSPEEAENLVRKQSVEGFNWTSPHPYRQFKALPEAAAAPTVAPIRS